MYLNKPLPQPQPLNKAASHLQVAKPDYAELVKFLVKPFLESPDSLSVDCEISHNTARVWIRVAFESEDKGRVFGRGGRNIQAIRTVIAAAAELAGHSAYLDIYGSQSASTLSESEEAEAPLAPTKSREQYRNGPKPASKPRPRSSFN